MGGQPPPGPPDGGPLPTRVVLVEHEEHDRQRVLGVDSVEIPRYLLGLSEIAATDGFDEGGVGGRDHRTHVRITDGAEAHSALGAGLCARCPKNRLDRRSLGYRLSMAEKPTLYVCHGDDGGPRIHPCRRVQEALRAKGIEYEKVIAAHGSPIPFLRKGSREDLRAATGDTKLPALKLADGTVIVHSKAILSWVADQP